MPRSHGPRVASSNGPDTWKMSLQLARSIDEGFEGEGGNVDMNLNYTPMVSLLIRSRKNVYMSHMLWIPW